MAQPLAESEIQQLIHTLLEGDPDTPDTTDDDYLARRILINNAILTWESEREANWRELWIADHSGGTVTNNTTAYSAPATFKSAGGFVRLVDGDSVLEIPVVQPAQAQTYESTEKIAYFTGNPQDGYTLNFRFTPVTADGLVGRTIKYDYYKFADTISSSSDIPEMTDPMFIVYKVVAQIFGQRSNFNMYSVFENNAYNSLSQMKIANAVDADYQDNELSDTSVGLGV